ncbi:uncharacterized protein F5891DRAFT_1247293 [Suillus fuscotomentosus]|uniref:Plastocyanin-like domain-containing protein n=1 Tax=Suillus fuscotomentosus TaxID=1912939 RepID=A0AAD4E0Q0_9AGAM|nr:uncharacterized protein F5891DRAFT_1247293 [Suillus fuscotomentosus]KAG1896329.1 hypothetical protein F5891DRAFT_1247293 [Suillus fuscotomentosus]
MTMVHFLATTKSLRLLAVHFHWRKHPSTFPILEDEAGPLLLFLLPSFGLSAFVVVHQEVLFLRKVHSTITTTRTRSLLFLSNLILRVTIGCRTAQVIVILVALTGGTHPGPTTVAQKRDTFKINVTNQLTNDSKYLRNQMDGVSFITQCPIAPGHSFLYDFNATDQVGTYWYHSHYGRLCSSRVAFRPPLLLFSSRTTVRALDLRPDSPQFRQSKNSIEGVSVTLVHRPGLEHGSLNHHNPILTYKFTKLDTQCCAIFIPAFTESTIVAFYPVTV